MIRILNELVSPQWIEDDSWDRERAAKFLTETMQAEYDRHVQSYRKGCQGCIVGAWAIRDLSLRLDVKIEEQKL